jgi:hypothetical protein
MRPLKRLEREGEQSGQVQYALPKRMPEPAIESAAGVRGMTDLPERSDASGDH